MNVLHQIFDHLPVACFYLNHQGVITYINQSALLLFGRSAEDCIGKKPSSVFGADLEVEDIFETESIFSALAGCHLRIRISPADKGKIITFLKVENLDYDLQKFLLRLNDELRTLEDPLTIEERAATLLASELRLGWVYYGTGDVTKDHIIAERPYVRQGLHKIKGELLLTLKRLFEGEHAPEHLSITDMKLYPKLEEHTLAGYAEMGMRSLLAVPIRNKEGKLAALIAAADDKIRSWTEKDLILLEEVASRTCTALEKANSEALKQRLTEALQLSEERLQLAIKAANIITWDVDPDTGDTQYSGNFREVLGFAISNHAEENYRHIHPEDRKRVIDTVNQAAAGRSLLDIEHRMVNPDTGEVIWLRIQGQMVQKALGNYSLIGISQNITERKLSTALLQDYNIKLAKEVLDRTEELQQNFALLQTIYDTTLIGMSVFAPERDEHGSITDFRIMIVNKKIERSTGRTDMTGKLYSELYPGIKKMGLFDTMVQAFETGEPQKTEYHYTEDGVDRWYATMFVKGGDLLVSTNLDVTERVVAEEERYRNFLLLQQSEELAQIGSWDFDPLNGSFIWSDGMYRLFDVQKGLEIAPEIYLRYATPGSRMAARRVVAHLRAGDKEFEDTIEIVVNGNTKVVHLKAIIVKSHDGAAVHVLGVDMDVTAMMEAEGKLRQLEIDQQHEIFQVTLNAQETERRHLSESLHNGLGQLLYGTKLNLNYLTIKLAGDDPEKYTASKRYTGELLTAAIEETRRISHELMPTVLAEFGLSTAIKEVCSQLQDGVKFRCSVSMSDLLVDNYLELAIFRTVQELMMNVVKHAQASRAKVMVVAKSSVIKIRVKDNGRGMPVNATNKPGIGLISIRNKVKLLNGELTIISQPGKGTSVEVHFPMPAYHNKKK
jgi:PAS domain S-box-containing protein